MTMEDIMAERRKGDLAQKIVNTLRDPATLAKHAEARIDVKKHPQYKGVFDNHVMVKVNKRIGTGLAMSFDSGDITICDFTEREGGYVSAFSYRNGVKTLMNPNWVVRL